ncbi:MAG TPA: PEP-CTERM sorting domain-containing protein [Steroidobacteraceae bacterium]|nr:PEP-CTERM sorting domain-containing protein [Steroidobacteraceae bacterium]
MKRAAPYCLASLLALFATAAPAVPVSFTFSTVIDSIVTDVPGPPMPPPFSQPASILGASITGSFTIETEGQIFPAVVFENNVAVPVGLFYFNPVLRYDLTVVGQPVSFVSTDPSILESDFVAVDLTAPRPTVPNDVFALETLFGTQSSGPFEGLSVFAQLVRLEPDLTVIQSTDMLLGLTTPAEWSLFLTFRIPRTQPIYQIHGNVTDLQQAIAVPEPDTARLFIVGLALLGVAARRRVSVRFA